VQNSISFCDVQLGVIAGQQTRSANPESFPAIDGGGSMINMGQSQLPKLRAGRTNFLSNIPPPAFHFKWGVGQGSKAPEGKMWDELEFLLGAKTSETTSSCSPPPVRGNDQYIGWRNGRCLGVCTPKQKCFLSIIHALQQTFSMSPHSTS
jgi:hypothetical protein